MATRYRIVQWDCMGFGLHNPEIEADTIEEAAKFYCGPADVIWAVDSEGKTRALTSQEHSQILAYGAF